MLFNPHKPFLTARWSNLTLINFAVPPERLSPLMPDKLEPDLHQGSAFVSLVAFDFLNTRVLGVPWPGYVNFPEVNLRFYVRHGERRGVMFVREFIPQQLPCMIARALYNEPYAACDLTRLRDRRPAYEDFETRLRWSDQTHSITQRVLYQEELPPEDSEAHFFKEHKWGFGRDHSGRLLRYKVLHPEWRIRPVQETQLYFDWFKVYGPHWAFLNHEEPHSSYFALGSEVAVFPPTLMSTATYRC